MSEHERVEQVFELIDKVTGPLARITEKVEKTAERVTELAAAFIGFEGLVSFKEMVADLNETYRAIGRIKNTTGVTTDSASNLVQVFEKMGVEATTTENVLARMERREGAIDDGAGKLEERFKHMGITAKEPEQKLVQMAAAAQKGLLRPRDLQMLGVMGESASKMMGTLRKGPEYMREAFEEAQKDGGHVNALMLQQFGEMQKAKREAKETFKALVNTVYSTFFPAITSIIYRIQEGIERWQPTAERWARFLTDHMERIVQLAKAFGKYMMVSHVVSKLGGGASVVGIAGKVLEGGLGKEGLGSVGGMIGPLVNIFTKFPGPMLAIGLAVGAILKHWDRFKPILEGIWRQLSSVYDKLKPVVSAITDFVLKLTSGALLMVFSAIADAIETVVNLARMLGIVMSEIADSPTKLLHPMELINQSWDKAKAMGLEEKIVQQAMDMQEAQVHAVKRGWQQHAADMADAAKRGGNYQDFRGSKFDIAQNFDKDFDPDRVGVALANEFGKIGERALQSGLAPLFGVR